MAGLAGCQGADWEERHEIDLDGSGRTVLRIPPAALPATGAGDPETRLLAALTGPGVEPGVVRLGQDGAWLAEARFDSFAALCRTPLFRRECALEPAGDGFFLTMSAPRTSGAGGGGGSAEIRIRPRGRIESHNSPEPLQRGNVLIWRTPLDELRAGRLDVQVTTSGISVFRAAAATVLRSAMIAAGLIGISLALVWREGRRRLRIEAEDRLSR